MKLKGKNIKRIPKEKKEKMKKTLKRMEKTRKKDTRYLRDIIETKLKWAKEAKSKILEEAKQLTQKLKTKQLILNQLNTIIPAFEELLESKKEKK